MLDRDGRTAFFHAVKNDLRAVCQFLLNQHDLDVNRKDIIGETALSLAFLHRCRAIIEMMLARKDVKWDFITEGGFTALHLAAEHDYQNFLIALKGKNIDVNKISSVGKTPLHIAAGKSVEAAFSALLNSKNINVNIQDKNGNTPLHIAVAKAFTYGVEALLKHPEININIRNGKGQTPEDISDLIDNDRIARLFIDKKSQKIFSKLWFEYKLYRLITYIGLPDDRAGRF